MPRTRSSLRYRIVNSRIGVTARNNPVTVGDISDTGLRLAEHVGNGRVQVLLFSHPDPTCRRRTGKLIETPLELVDGVLMPREDKALSPHSDGHVVGRFTDETRKILKESLPAMASRGWLAVEDECAVLDGSVYDALTRTIDIGRVDERVSLARGDVLVWYLRASKVLHPPAGEDALLALLEAAFPRFHVSHARFGEYLRLLVDDAQRPEPPAGRWKTLHCVPMRPPEELRRVIEEQLKRGGRDLYPDMTFYRSPEALPEVADSPACLLALDSYLNLGKSRLAFLRTLVQRFPDVLRRYERIVLGAVVGFDDMATLDLTPVIHEAAPELGPLLTAQRIQVRVGKSLEASRRSLSAAFRPGSTGEAALRRLMEAQGLAPAAWEAERTTLVSFYYGCPLDSLSLLWSDRDDWVPLCRPMDYYDPNAAPLVRAPLFSAHPRTLQALLDRIDGHQTVLLAAPQGRGKTYVAARALELRRPAYYAFWHDFVEFDTIENLLDHFSAFLRTFGFLSNLSQKWGASGGHSAGVTERELAIEVSEALQGLDRPTLIVLDRLQNVAPPEGAADGAGETRLWLFVRELVAALAQDRRRVSRQSLVLIVQTEPEGESGKLTALRESLALAKSCELSCPVDRDDLFRDPGPLATRLLPPKSLTRSVARSIEDLAYHDPYRVWLLCFCLNHAPGELKRTRKARLSALLDPVHGNAAGDIDRLHSRVDGFLTDDERTLLQVASAFRRFWSADDLAAICRVAGVSGDPLALLWGLLEDRAPFFTRLGRGADPVDLTDGRALRAQQLDAKSGQVDPRERFEMPSVAASYYRSCLKKCVHTSAKAYAALAGLMAQQAEQNVKDASAAAERGDSATAEAKTARAAMARVQQIFYYCEAQMAGAAAKLYADASPIRDGSSYEFLRRQKSWDRIRYLGKRILDGESRGGDHFPDELRYEATAMYANALAESMDTETAYAACEETLGKYPGVSAHWKARLHLVQAKCRRYQGDYDEVQPLFRDAIAAFERSTERDRSFWRCRGLSGLVQCEMGGGELAAARMHLEEMRRVADEELASDPSLGQIHGLARRHHGTLLLLEGDLDGAATQLSETGSEKADDRGLAIRCFKLARVEVERARIAEAAYHLTDAQAHLGALEAHLDRAQGHLKKAREALRGFPLGSPKWHLSTEVAELEIQLLRRRHKLPEGNGVAGRRERIAAIVAKPRSGPRALEARIMLNSWAYQDLLDGAKQKELSGRLGEACGTAETDWDEDLRRDEFRFRSCARFEQAYYLWRLTLTMCDNVWGAGALQGVLEDLAIAYRAGTSALYRSRAFRAAAAFHMLAAAAFRNGVFNLQERLEAAVWLHSPVLAGIASEVRGSVSPPQVLEEITVGALWANAGSEPDAEPEDRFFTIPAKICARWLNDASGYREISEKKQQPSAPPPHSDATAPEVVQALTVLRDACCAWFGAIGACADRAFEPSVDRIRAYCDSLRRQTEHMAQGSLDEARWARATEKVARDISGLIRCCREQRLQRPWA